ncbi:MAG: crossover junction endodeoxyribonuclease RuvC [Brevinema sp.]
MIICGIDPGYDRAGYGFLKIHHQQVHEVLSYGLISTDKKKSFPERLFELGSDVDLLFQKYQPSHLFIEKLFMGRNTTTVLQVAEVRGVLCYLAQKHSIAITEIAPKSIKKIVSGYGNADKHQMIQAITLLLNLPEAPQPDDVADALALAFCGYIKHS